MSKYQPIDRIMKELGHDDLLDLLQHELSSSDLNTLLLELFRRKAIGTSPAELLKQYAGNRFVHPSELDPIALKRMEIDLLSLAQARGFQPVQLSPIAPLGSCSVVGTADQNKIISALRGTEVIADATNALALHICHGLKTSRLSHAADTVRVCTTHRHVRAQHFQQPGLLSHFHLFCMVTSGQDQGSYAFEKKTLTEHLAVYRDIFSSLFDAEMKVSLNARGGYTDGEGLLHSLSAHLQETVPGLPVIENTTPSANNYYQGVQFTITAVINGQELNIGDGGFVDWPKKLLGRKKERMMISAIGLERLAAITSS
ncbi:hypothetical protein ACHHV8_00515 [Paenibacillus sp. TAB 01]|uniref:hypothetical protein n=1 Tax=Paenibacillus sp. TAB 01 TaxID=3368988 RepID=UPI003753E374